MPVELYCPNCGRFFHVHCAAGWAEAQSQKEGMPPNVFKCPVCFSLLKVPGAVNRVKILQARLKEEFIPPTDKVDMKKVKVRNSGQTGLLKYVRNVPISLIRQMKRC